MIAALYARYSSDNQREESIVAQVRASRDYCQRKGYSIVKEYADEALTGTNDDRPAYRQMMADAALGLFEVVVFHKVDRSARNEFDYYKGKQQLAKHNVTVEYSGQSFDSSSPEGALMENQLVGLAAYYSRNLAREVKKGLKENVLAGKITGGQPAFGYAISADKKYVINESEAVAVRYIFSQYAKGASYMEICQYLNQSGYRTRRGKAFGKNSLHDLLKNRRYIGTCILGKNQKYTDGHRNSHREDHDGMIIVENGCPAIVSKEVFSAVHDRMKENRHRGGSHTAKYDYLLSGLVYCGYCGSSMSGSRITKKKGNVNVYYRCGTKSRKGINECPSKYINASKLESFIIGRLAQTINNSDLLSRIVDHVREKYAALSDSSTAKRARLAAREKKLLNSLDRLYDSIESGMADDFDRERMKKIKHEILDVRTELKTITNTDNLPSAPTIMSYIRDQFTPLLKSKKARDLKALIRAFVSRITVTNDKVFVCYALAPCWCSLRDSNPRPPPCDGDALAN